MCLWLAKALTPKLDYPGIEPVMEDDFAASAVTQQMADHPDTFSGVPGADDEWYHPHDTTATTSAFRTSEPDGLHRPWTTTPDTLSFQTPATGTMATESGSQPAASEHHSAPQTLPPSRSAPSYAQAARNTGRSSFKPRSPSSSSPVKPTETSRLHRTQVLRRLPYNTTTRHIITDLTRQMGCSEILEHPYP